MDAPRISAWLKARINRAEPDWQRLLGAMYRHLLDQPFDQLVDKVNLRAVIDRHLEAERATALARLVFRGAVRPLVDEGRRDNEPIGRWLPPDAHQKLEALAAEPGLIGRAWVEELFSQSAAEELLAEVLYQSLKDFSTLVPRVMQKVLPSGLGRIAGFAASAGGKVFDEVERLLDGEIRRFLEKGTRKGLDRAAAFAAQNLDGPTALEGRRNMVRFVLAKSGQFHLEPLTDPRIDTLESVAEAAATHFGTREETGAVVDRFLDRIWSTHQGRTVREVLASVGVEEEPPYDDWLARPGRWFGRRWPPPKWTHGSMS